MNSIKFIIPLFVLFFALVEETYFYNITSSTIQSSFQKNFVNLLMETMSREQEYIEYLIRKNNFEKIRSNIAAMGSDIHLKEAFLINSEGKIDAALHQMAIGFSYDEYILKHSSITDIKCKQDVLKMIKSLKNKPKMSINYNEETNKMLGVYPIDYGLNEDDPYKDTEGLLIFIKDTKFMYEKMNQEMRRDFVPFAVFMIISLIVLIAALHFYITRRIQRLEDQSKLYIEGNLDVDFSVAGNDEIAKLGKTFNAMIEKIYKSKYELKKEVAVRTKELESSLSELKEAQESLIESEKMASLGSLVSGIAHEVNTPIGTSLTGVTHINFLSQAINDNLQENKLKQSSLQTYLDDVIQLTSAMESSLTNAAELIKSLKQISVDQHTEVKRNFNLHNYVEDVLISLKNVLKKKDIVIKNTIADSLEIESYPGFFSQILNNFINNSILHAFDKTHNPTITISTKVLPKKLTFVYSDNGGGMDQETLKHLFEPFYTTKMGQGGTGLGMYIIYNIVTTKLDGTITCDSSPEEGTKFEITIPMEEVLI